MSESEEYGSAKEGELAAPEKADPESSEDEPLANKKTPVKQAPKKKTISAKKGKKGGKKDIENSPKEVESPAKSDEKKRASVSFAVDPLEIESDEEAEEEYEVEAIVGHREYNGKLVYKIRWKGYDAKQDTWEDHNSLSCPDLLEMYNTKHEVSIPKKGGSSSSKGRGRPKGSTKGTTKAKDPKSPISYESEEEEEDEADDDGSGDEYDGTDPKKKRPASKRGRGRPKGATKVKKRKSSLSDESVEDEEEADDDDVCDDGSGDEYEVDKIVDMRLKKNGTREFRVHWKRWSPQYDTWEPEENLNCQDVIAKFMEKVEEAKNSNVKELRIDRKHTERFTLNTRDSGRRLSRRHNNKQRVKYFDADAGSESD